jgi:hypothetical protein
MVGMMFAAARYLEANFQTLKAFWDATAEPYIRTAINTGEGLDEIVKDLYLPTMFRGSGLTKAREWFKDPTTRELQAYYNDPEGGYTSWPEKGYSDMGCTPWDVARD